jgi:fibronectin-binding autotransporter adhesin
MNSSKLLIGLTLLTFISGLTAVGETVVISSRSGDATTGANNPAFSLTGFSATPSSVHSSAAGNTALSSRFANSITTTPSITVTASGLVPFATYEVSITFGTATGTSTPSTTVVVTTSTTGTSSSTLPSSSTAFQSGSGGVNAWLVIGSIVPNGSSPAITFTYSGGTVASSSRWYADSIRLVQTAPPPPPVTGIPLYWDPSGATGLGGSGTWDTTSALWNTAADASATPQAYTSSYMAVFSNATGTVTIGAGGISTDGGLEFDIDGYVLQGGALSLGTGTNISVTSLTDTATINSRLSGSTGLLKNGQGTLILGGSNDFTGPVTVNTGTLQLATNQTWSSLTGEGTLALGANTLTVNGAQDGAFLGVISDAGAGTPGSLVKQGAGMLSLNGVNTFGGTVTVNGGTLSIGSAAGIGIGTSAVSIDNATLQSTAAGAVLFLNSETRPVVIGPNGGTLGVTATSGILQYRNGTISGTGNTVKKSGAGTLRLSNTASQPNTHTLVTTRYLVVNAGLWQVGIDTALGEVPVSPLADAITLTGGGGISANGSFEVNSNRLITLASTATFDTTSSMTYNGVISGTANAPIHKTGANTLTLGGNNTFNGIFQLEAGTLALASDAALGTAVLDFHTAPIIIRSADSSPRTVANAVTFGASTGFGSATTGDLVFNGDVNSGNNPKTFAVTNAVTRFNGVISGGPTANANTKDGPGTLLFTGANTYTKPTVINLGTLRVNNTSGSATGVGTVTVAAAGTLAGSGSISGAVTLNGTIAPGNSCGTLNTGDETWAGGGHYSWQINAAGGSAGAEPGWDLVNISGGLTVTATAGSKFTIDITSLSLADAAGPVSDFNNTATYAWSIAKTTGSIMGFDPKAFTLNTAGFANSLGEGAFIITATATDLVLRFVHKPVITSNGAAGHGSFTGAPTATYTVQYANDLSTPINWQTLMSVTTDGAGFGTFADPSAPANQAQRFYRVSYP